MAPVETGAAATAEVADILARVVEIQARYASPNRVDHYRVPKIASFFRADLALWFIQTEISFRNANITVESTKADIVLASLDVEVLGCVKDIISIDPAPADIYKQIKARIISTFAVSDEAKLRRLLKGRVTCTLLLSARVRRVRPPLKRI